MPRIWKWLLLSAAIVVIDQITKALVLQGFALHQSVALTPFFNLVLVYNTGAAFSLLSDAPGWQRELFIGIAAVASAWIVYLLARYSHQRLFSLSLSLVLGGAVGNVIDRVRFGAVVDFLDFHAAGYHWPAFNVADAGITCGALLLVWDAFRTPAPAA